MVSAVVIDAETGQDVAVDELDWYCKRPDGVHGGGFKSAKRGEDGRYVFGAPETEIVLFINNRDWYGTSEPMQLAPSGNELTLKVTRKRK